MKRYKVKKVKAKHAYFGISHREKCINKQINSLKRTKRGLIIISAISGTLSLISLSSIALVKDNDISQISLDIILSACTAVISYCLIYEAKETSKQLTLSKKNKSNIY